MQNFKGKVSLYAAKTRKHAFLAVLGPKLKGKGKWLKGRCGSILNGKGM